MPLLSYSAITNFPFQKFKKIYSADMNLMFTTIQTLLNTTGLDDTNLQNAGITPTTKLKVTGATAGQVLGYNGSGTSPSWISVGNTTLYNVIFGSSAQVSAGVATNSSFASWTQADGDRVLILPGYSESASWTLSKKVFVVGLGATSQITGSVTLNTGATESIVRNLRVSTGGITIASGVTGVFCKELFFGSSGTFTDNNTSVVNYLEAYQE